MKTLLRTFLLVAVIFVVAVAAERIVPLKQLSLYLDQHPEPYRTITIAMSAAGWVLFIIVFVLLIWTRGRPMREDEARRFMQAGAGQPMVSRIMRGPVTECEFNVEVPFKAIKQAILTGEWLHEPNWWPLVIGLLAITLIAYGMFGFFFVVGAPLVKLLCGGSLVYATLRTVWGFWRA